MRLSVPRAFRGETLFESFRFPQPRALALDARVPSVTLRIGMTALHENVQQADAANERPAFQFCVFGFS